MDELKKELFYQQKNGYDLIDAEERKACEDYCKGYMAYLNESRTEREAVIEGIKLAEKAGFVPVSELTGPIQPGQKVYYNNRGKTLLLAVGGKKPMSEGVVIEAAHVDAPHIDLKPQPLFEDTEMGYLRTRYYGGIKKYQWATIPLELHGTIALKDGSTVDVVIGKDKNDPQFVINDLLPHLAQDQLKKPLAKGIEGEQLCVLAGSVPYAGEGSDRVKLALMSILHDRYGITEADFLSADLQIVPSFDVRELGLDRSMIGGFGQDDRVCSYAELAAILDIETPERTAVCILTDKEEIGSHGVTGMKSRNFEWFIGKLSADPAAVQGIFSKSICISADVTVAFDPMFPEVCDKQNTAKINYGVGFCKYTGGPGKAGCSEATAEFTSYIRRICDEAGVVWQMCEIGKVDQGGGGTVAAFMAERDISVIDAGVPVLSMHAPFETTSKFDCYMTYKFMKAAYEAK